MPAIGAVAATSCFDCPFGYYCDDTLSPGSIITPAGCPTGQFCIQKTGGVTLAQDCIAGQFCSTKAGAAYDCPWGQYQASTKQTACVQCPNARMCSTKGLGNAESCSPFHYCQQDAAGAGTAISQLCPEGQLVPATEANPDNKTKCQDIDKNHWYRSPGND